jgi:ribonuclease Z
MSISYAFTHHSVQVDAIRKRHSTMGEAVEIAKRMGAKHVVLTHFSSRYSYTPQLPLYLFQAGNISLARDFMVARFNELEHLPKLLPLYKQLYQEKLKLLDAKGGRREKRRRVDSVE